jgi:uncharacterized protein (TIGR02147 family)
MSEIILKKYLNPRQYLKDLFLERKHRDPSFSLLKWAQELGLESRSALRLVLTGRKPLSRELATKLAHALQMSPADAEYFFKLVGMESAVRKSEREKLVSEVSSLSTAGEELPDSFQLLASPLVLKLLVLLSFEDLEKTEANLALLLKTNPARLSSILKELKAIDVVEEQGGLWQAKKPNFFIKDHLGSASLQTYHKESLEEAIAAIRLPKEERRFRSILIPLDEEEFAMLYGELNLLLENLVARFGKAHAAGTRLYQINLNLLPVTEKLPVSEQDIGSSITV